MVQLIQMLFVDLKVVLVVQSRMTQVLLVQFSRVLVHLDLILLILLVLNVVLVLLVHLGLIRMSPLILHLAVVLVVLVVQQGEVLLLLLVLGVLLDLLPMLLLVLDWVLVLVLLQVHLSVELLLLLALNLVVDLVLDVLPVPSSEDWLQVQTALTHLLPRNRLDQHMDPQLSPDRLLLCRRPRASENLLGHGRRNCKRERRRGSESDQNRFWFISR